ncbi:hypothetical protein FH972_006278 [Carpinus fangiana]|uniref:Uncharacterized protein n=1 Tax=Carpinus fangiana TaxID=176857 RepID=A0A5N6QV25_9ROSI|nr:hypothetical protein FH972_006278 [Carpinus fangiana]
MTLAKQYIIFSRVAYAKSIVALCVFLSLPTVVAFRQEVLIWKQMKEPAIAIIVQSLEAVKEEQNSSTNQVKVEEDTIIVEQEKNSLDETQTFFIASICNKPKRGKYYGIIQSVIHPDIHIIFLAPVVGLDSFLTTMAYMPRIGELLQYDPNIHLYLVD